MRTLPLLETAALSVLAAVVWFSTEASEAPKAPEALEATVAREYDRDAPQPQARLKGYWDRRP